VNTRFQNPISNLSPKGFRAKYVQFAYNVELDYLEKFGNSLVLALDYSPIVPAPFLLKRRENIENTVKSMKKGSNEH
jgi:hypothetical protein